MFQLVFSPNWFFGKDILMDIVAVLILLMLGFVSMRHYDFFGRANKKHFYFGLSFFLLALSFLAKIATNFTIYYYQIDVIQRIKTLIIVEPATQSVGMLFFLGFLCYHLFMLWGLYGLYAVINDEAKKSTMVLCVGLIALLTYFTNHLYYIFHFTALFILLLIVIRYQKNYINNKSLSTKYLMVSFGLMGLSQALFIFLTITTSLYVIAEIVQLLGFLTLLITLIRVFKHGKEKKPNRHHK